MNKTSNVGKYIIHIAFYGCGSVVVTWQVGCTKAVLSALRERHCRLRVLDVCCLPEVARGLDKEI